MIRFRSTISPLFSLFLLMLGNAFLTTLFSLELDRMGYSEFIISTMWASFSVGFIIGSFRVEAFIVRVSHIRAYVTFASLLTSTILIQGIYINVISWIVLRFLSGIFLAGVYVVIESWLLSSSAKENRGRVLSFYMISLYVAQASSQLILNIEALPFLNLLCLASIASSLSIIPLAVTRVSTPVFENASMLSLTKLCKISSEGIVSCVIGGLALGSVYSLLPLYKADYNVSVIMSAVIFGGVLLQYPIGKISDFIDRRKVLLTVSLLIIVVSILILSLSHFWYLFVILIFIFGGLVFTIYPLGISIACDLLDNRDIIAATQSLLIAYNIGAILSPFAASSLSHYFSKGGLFIYFILISLLLTFFLITKIRKLSIISSEKQPEFMALTHSTAISSELDPRGDEIEDAIIKEKE